MPSVRPHSLLSLLLKHMLKERTNLPNANTSSLWTRREDYGFVSGWWLGLQTFVHDIWRPARNAPRTMATRTAWRGLLSTLALSKARLSCALQPACPSEIVAIMCPLFMPLSPFRDSCPISSPRCCQNDRISSCRFRYGKVYW